MRMLNLIIAMIWSLLATLPARAGDDLLVFAAASQRDALLEIGERYGEICNCKVVFSFAATSTLARQIDAGARADAVFAAWGL